MNQEPEEAGSSFGIQNLGPMVVSWDDYVKSMVDQHLLDRKPYEIFSKEEAQEYLIEGTSTFLEFISQNVNSVYDINLKAWKI